MWTVFYIFNNGPPLPPQNCLLPCGDLDSPSDTWFLGPTEVHNPKGISVCSVIFATFAIVTDRQTNHSTPSVTIGCIYVRSAAVWPNNTVIYDTYIVKQHEYEACLPLHIPHCHQHRIECKNQLVQKIWLEPWPVNAVVKCGQCPCFSMAVKPCDSALQTRVIGIEQVLLEVDCCFVVCTNQA